MGYQRHIEYTNLKSPASKEIRNIVEIANDKDYFGVCLNSECLSVANKYKGKNLKIITVAGFPPIHSYSLFADGKNKQIQLALGLYNKQEIDKIKGIIDSGLADEIDLVFPIYWYVTGHFLKIHKFLKGIRNRYAGKLKVICELGTIFNQQTALYEIVDLLRQSGIDYFKCLAESTSLFYRQKGDPEIKQTTIKSFYKIFEPNKYLFPSIEIKNGKKELIWVPVCNMYKNNKTNKCRSITFGNGAYVTATENHKFPVLNRNNSWRDKQNLKYTLVKAKDLKVGDKILHLNYLKNITTNNTMFNYSFGLFVGFFMAEGNFTTKGLELSISKKDLPIIEKMKPIVQKFGGEIKMYPDKKTQGISVRINIKFLNSIMEYFIGGHNAKNKTIKQTVFKQSLQFRMGFIDGFLAGDGHKVSENFFTVSLCDNRYLIKRLRLLTKTVGYQLSGGEHISIVTIKDKKYKTRHFNINTKPINEFQYTPIKSIRKTSKEVQTYDIEIDSDSHLYFIGEGILTHNSNTGLIKQDFDSLLSSIMYCQMVMNDFDITMDIKASGGIKTKEQVDKLLEIGVKRIGTSSLI